MTPPRPHEVILDGMVYVRYDGVWKVEYDRVLITLKNTIIAAALDEILRLRALVSV